MGTSGPSQRFALLVGIDYYTNEDARRHTNGEPVTLRSLKGCVRDVEIIRDLLQTGFGFENPRILTSSAAPDERVDSLAQDDRPTFSNIEREFDKIHAQARAGDLFLFHFSGHGAQLKTTSESPTGRSTDPSLMTWDYCNGEPAIRGWQLNAWLRRLHDKQVRVVVLLDSCHSGGAWRAGRQFRSPEHWTPPPNLPSDETAVQATQTKPGSRKGDLEVSWDINPEGFTLMAACRADQRAEEIMLDNATCGAFTAALKEFFETQSIPSTATYRAIREFAASKIESQDPQVFGRDRLLFLGNQEPFSVTPTFVEIQERVSEQKDARIIPIGMAHGIVKGAQFTTYPPAPRVILSVRKPGDFESEMQVLVGQIESLEDPGGVIPWRWSFGGALKVYIDPKIGLEFREQLKANLQERVVEDIPITESTAMPTDDHARGTWFWVRLGDSGNIQIVGREALLGHPGPIRGWETNESNVNSRAADSAVALAHLARFTQLLHLDKHASQDSPSFTVTLESDSKGPLYPDKTRFKLILSNDEDADLFFTVLILSSGFHVRQLYPPHDEQKVVPPKGVHSFSFKLQIPDELGCYKLDDEQARCRDIVRVIVTRGKKTSFKSMELPDIWNAGGVDSERRANRGRNGTLELDCKWWVQDHEVWLSPARAEDPGTAGVGS